MKLSLGKSRDIIYSGVVPVLKVFYNSTIGIHNDKEAQAFRDEIVKRANLHEELVKTLGLVYCEHDFQGCPDNCFMNKIEKMLNQV